MELKRSPQETHSIRNSNTIRLRSKNLINQLSVSTYKSFFSKARGITMENFHEQKTNCIWSQFILEKYT